MPDWLGQWVTHLRDHGAKLLAAAVFTAVGWGIGRWRARRAWKSRDFLSRLNFSLNILSENRLLIRTIMEKSCEEVFLNQSAVEAVLKAARQTTAANPLLPLDREDYWYFLNQVLNELSEKFAEGILRRDMGLPVTMHRYLICLTSESAGDIRTRKIRAMIIQKGQLLALPEEVPQLESPHHATRWATLQIMQARYIADPTQFLELELSV